MKSSLCLMNFELWIEFRHPDPLGQRLLQLDGTLKTVSLIGLFV